MLCWHNVLELSAASAVAPCEGDKINVTSFLLRPSARPLAHRPTVAPEGGPSGQGSDPGESKEKGMYRYSEKAIWQWTVDGQLDCGLRNVLMYSVTAAEVFNEPGGNILLHWIHPEWVEKTFPLHPTSHKRFCCCCYCCCCCLTRPLMVIGGQRL